MECPGAQTINTISLPILQEALESDGGLWLIVVGCPNLSYSDQSMAKFVLITTPRNPKLVERKFSKTLANSVLMES